jgi:RNA polymerase sigma factor (sigma-70 family)
MRDDERELWERYRPGDQQALEDLLVHYTGLVHYWANQVASIAPWVDRDDLIQEGLIILVKVIEKFDLSRGYEFSTYAGPWLREALLDHLQDARNITDYLYRQCRKVNKAQEILMRRLDRKPTVAEIAEETELTEQQVEKVLNAIAISRADELTADDSDWLMSSATVESPETIVLINELLLKLSERERWILTEYYDLGRTDKEIAEQRGLTPDNVKRIRSRALKKLAKLIEATGR